VTTFNQFAVVSENRLTAVPQDFDLKLAPLFGCAVTTGLGLVNNKARVKFGESFVVFGAGGVGLNVIQGASMASADPIVAVDLFDTKLEMAKRLGASHIINSTNTNPQKAIPSIVGDGGADVVVDNTGNPKIIEMAYNLTAPHGKTILVGVPKKGYNASIYTLPLHFGKQLTGTRGGESMPANDIPRYIKLYQSGKLKLDGLITDRFGLTEINAAIGQIRDGKIDGRCLIEMFS
jgi:S-(hydroxymethyl)glutathione dehydrogenase/alcohol dehydrogenase